MNNASNGRSPVQVMAEIKEEVKELTQIRLQLVQAKFQQQLAFRKIAGALAGGAVVLLATAYLLLTVGLVALIAAVWTDSPHRWVLGFFGADNDIAQLLR